MFQSVDAIALTGLSRSQLREWCGRDRRYIIPADVEPAGPGRHALFSWQTLLALRVLRAIHMELAAEVTAWGPSIRELRAKLDRVAFPSLWGGYAHFPSRTEARLIFEVRDLSKIEGLIHPLDPHLEALASRLSQPRIDQLALFPLRAIAK